MKAGVIIFPGSNCDRDTVTTLQSWFRGEWTESQAQGEVITIWHGETTLPALDVLFVPGGFTYGDYLRVGAMAAQSPIMKAIKGYADKGGRILGICNGFQILTEAGLLPGTLMRNIGQTFVCRTASLKIENTTSSFTRDYSRGEVISLPVAHHDGNFYADDETLTRLENEGQVLLRYCDSRGNVSEDTNFNGSCNNIAGICSNSGRIAALMPHPERICDPLTGGMDGRKMFTSILAA
jgi:phosphoribosylformylglycinamidine synthase